MTGTETAIRMGAARFSHQVEPKSRPETAQKPLAQLILESPDGGAELVNEYCFLEAVATAARIEAHERGLTENGHGGPYLHRSVSFGD